MTIQRTGWTPSSERSTEGNIPHDVVAATNESRPASHFHEASTRWVTTHNSNGIWPANGWRKQWRRITCSSA